MAMDDLSALFDSVDGLAEDLMEYGTIAGVAVATNVGFKAAVEFGLSKFPTLPGWVSQWAVPGAAVLLGGVGVPMAAGKLGVRGKVATGVSVGLMYAGIMALAKNAASAAGVSVPGLGNFEDQYLMGVGDSGDLFNRYLGQGSVGVENVNGLGGATMMIESVNGLGATTTIESVNGFAGYGIGNAGFAAALQ